MDRIPKTPPVIPPLKEGEQTYLWSVMIPTYNCIGYLKETLESVLVQDPGKELMQIEVIDDHSTDGDVEELVRTIGKGRIGYFKQESNRGSLRNFETYLNRSKGRWVHILHGDDCVKPGFYKEIDMLFQLDPSIGAAFVNNSTVDEDGKLISVHSKILQKPGVIDDFLSKIACYQRLEPVAIVVKRHVYEKLGGFYAVHYGEDWEMWTRIALHYGVGYSPKTLASYRALRNGSISNQYMKSGQNLADLIKVIDIIQCYLPPFKRKQIRNISLKHYSVFSAKVANGILHQSREAALYQAQGAWKLSKSAETIYWLLRFYIRFHITGRRNQ